MGAAKALVAACDGFHEANMKFEDIKRELLSTESLHASHSTVEQMIRTEGRELLRRLYQAHLDARGDALASGPVVGADGVERTHIRKETSRELVSTLGRVEVPRARYEGRGMSGLHPTDAELELPQRVYSHELEREVAQHAVEMSFDKAIEFIEMATGVDVPKRQAEELVVSAAQDFEGFYAQQEVAAVSDRAFLVLSVDQKGIVMRHEDLLPETREKAKAGRKLETRFTRGEPRNRKRMATVAAVYEIEPDVRDAATIIAGLRHIKPTEPVQRPRPQNKRVWASVERGLTAVIEEMFDQAERVDPKHERTWIVLLDGDRKLEQAVRKTAKARRVEVTIVLDFIHVLQYLWAAGHKLCEEGTAELEKWVMERLERILKGHVSDVAAGMRRSATKRRLTEEERKPIDRAADYFLKRRALMHYDICLEAGTPIATGVIEGSCRTLINDRLDVTGARWRLKGAEAVLKLRALTQSGDFKEYWAYHLKCEYHRNHASKYERETPPGLVLPGRKPQLRLVK
jgi:hypothetical protein